MNKRWRTIVQNEWRSLLRGKWMFSYALIFLTLTDLMLRFGHSGPEVLLSLSNVMLLFVPLVGMIYGTLYIYQSREFIELLLTQPVDRRSIYWGLFLGISTPLMAAFAVGGGLPLLWHGLLWSEPQAAFMVLGLGAILTLVFAAIGFYTGLWFYDDRIKGFGITMVVWLFLAILYDGLILLLIAMLGNFPVDRLILGITLLNPVDLARILVLLEFDISALMGYTGAIFREFFGSKTGVLVSFGMLMVWVVLPVRLGLRQFEWRDF
ncbi:MAG: ABC transporter permease subunit [Balneolaceae bacterium]